ncbi:MAG: cytochrome c [Phycisphaerales bacterium]|nr:cytochrome c [Phycisphaerales bacterium]
MNGPGRQPGRRAVRHQVVIRAAIAVAGFAAYAGAVWLSPMGTRVGAPPEGVRAWRAAGCQSCHALFGLGGHLGPDLTFVVTRRPEGFVDVMMRSPPEGMPSFAGLSDAERAAIVDYLRAVDAAAREAPKSWFTGGGSGR